MFHDIYPHVFDNHFVQQEAAKGDFVISVFEDKLLLRKNEGDPSVPTFDELHERFPEKMENLHYLITVDDKNFFLSTENFEDGDYAYFSPRTLLEIEPAWIAFAAATGVHLANWYQSRVYCGRCAHAMEHSDHERALVCPACGQTEYPKISPVVIVAISSGENLLLTKYARAPYRRYALVAGFVEIGETIEEAAAREALEEVGLKLKNIRYYKSQPWPITESLIMGLFAEVDGDATVALDQEELAEATWFERTEIPHDDTSSKSITWSLINAFRNGEDKLY